MMDIDIQDQLMEDIQSQSEGSGGTRSESKKPVRVVVDDAHPFELESYIAGYSGRGAIYRLFHIMHYCPALAHQAYTLAIQRITNTPYPTSPSSASSNSNTSPPNTHPTSSTHPSPSPPLCDPSLYRTAVSIYNALPEVADGSHTKKFVDNAWVEQVQIRNAKEKGKLELELKTYQSNMIKESIRMAHRDLGDFHRATGDDASALKHYTKSREFCSSAPHVLEMCISVLELLLEQRNFAQVSTYVFKAEAAFDATVAASSSSSTAAHAAAASSSTPPPPTTTTSAGLAGSSAAPASSHSQTQAAKKGPTASQSHQSAEREKIQAKLDVATGLAHFAQGNFEKAAQVLVRVAGPRSLGGWVGKIINPGDIAIIGTLSALATYSREAIKAQILASESFGVYLEHEPHVRDLLEAYMGSKFKTVLELLERYSTRHYLDIYLHPHVQDLTALIRDRALVLYFKPFASIKLARMSAAFGVEEREMERLVVGLIQGGGIKGRVDRRGGILKANVVDQRSALITHALQTANNIQAANRRLLLRMRLQQADLIVKAPRSQGGGGGPQGVEMLMD